MTHVLPAGPHDTRYQYTFRLEAVAIDKIHHDTTFRRTRLAHPLSQELIRAGYQVKDWRTVLQAASVTVAESTEHPGEVKVTAVVPRPPLVPANELNPEAAITVEYVGGIEDGRMEPHQMDPVIPPNLAIAVEGSVYTRTGYDLTRGAWRYQVQRNEPAEPAEVDDDQVWDAD